MTCREFIEFLDDWLQGELPAEAAREFQRHVGLCRACERYLDSYRTTQRLCAGVRATPPGGALPAGVPEELVQAILAARRRQAPAQ